MDKDYIPKTTPSDHSSKTASFHITSARMFEAMNDKKYERVIQYGIRLMEGLTAIMMQAQISINEKKDTE
mgnify:CR=1 FL=1